jgi:hypothetical protein
MTNSILKQTIIACVAVLGLASCTREEQTGVFAQAGETTMKLNISFPEQNTRASQDQNATDDEVKVSTIDIFIFNASTKKLENRVGLTAQEIEKDPSLDAYKPKSVEIRTTTGAKLVAAGINLPGNFPVISTSTELQKAWSVTTSALDNANGLVMFSTSVQSHTLVTRDDASYDAHNVINIPVERTLAKIAVQDGGYTATFSTGTISDVSFAMRNANTRLFPVQVIENGIVKDPNWAAADVYSSSDFEHFSDYVAVNDKANTDRRSWNTKYVPENTAEQPLGKTSTYASVRVKFTPARCIDSKGKEVQYNNGDDFWIVTHDGTPYYFVDRAEAQAFAQAKGATVSGTYANGYAYYNAFINARNGYNVIRNAFYNVKISLIVPPGSPTPEIEDPESPVKEPTNIKVSVDIEAWDYQEDEYPLS